MFNPETKPIKFSRCNGTLTGSNDVGDLPVWRTPKGNVVSCWKVPFFRRLRFLFTGRIYLAIKGKTHAPVWIEV